MAFIVLLVAAGTGSLRAQASFRTFEHAASGLRFRYPGEFKELPVQPTEKLVIGRFARKKPYGAKARELRTRTPEELYVFALAPQTEEMSADESPAGTVEEAVARRNAVSSYLEFVRSRFGRWRTKELGRRRRAADYHEFELVGIGRRKRKGYLLVRTLGSRSVGVVGFADEPVYSRFVKLFRVTGRSIEAPDGSDRVRDVSDAIYAGKDYRDVAFRLAARRRMVKGWSAYDTENFFIVSHTKNKSLVKRVANELEAMRPVYARYFPPVQPIEAVSVVRICRDLKEYRTYGGPAGSAGYWNPAAKELVLFDFTNVPKEQRGGGSKAKARKDSFIVLYHEAFHQYIYYAAGEIAPHMWFNEGMGDFFSGTVIYRNSRKVKGVGLNRWRIPVVKAALASGRFVPLRKLLSAERAQYYNRALVSVMYAEGWAFCYFLNEADESKADPRWRRIIPDYFARLQREYAAREKLLGDESTLADRRRVEKEARDAALKAALAGVDVTALERAWKAWITDVEDPWRRLR